MANSSNGGVFAPLKAHPQLLPFLLLICLIMSGNTIVTPVLSVYAATFSVSTTMVGMIVTLFGLGRLIADLPAGFLSQRFGRKPLLCLGPALIVASSAGAALARDFDALLVWRLLQGIGNGLYMTTSAAAIADISKKGERGRMMAWYQAALLTGAGLGPAIGGWLAHFFGFTAPFWGYAVMAALAMVVAWTSVEESAGAKAGGHHGGSVGPLLRNPVFLLLCLVNFGVFFTRTASQWSMIPLLAHETYGFGVEVIGLALAVAAAANFAMLPVTGWMVDRFGGARVVVWSTLATALSLALVALWEGPIGLWAGLVLFGIGGGLNGPAVGAHTVDVTPRETYGPALGVQRAFGDAGFLIGPIAVGLLDDLGSVGYSGGILFNAALVFASGLAFFFGLRAVRRDQALAAAE